MRFLRTIILLAVTALALVACSGGDLAEEILENQEGVGDVEIDENNGSVVIEVEDEEGGGSAVIGGGEVPADFPIPVPDGGTVAAVFTQDSDATVTLTYPASEYDSLVATYQDFVDGTGGEVNTVTSSSPASVTWNVTVGSAYYNISVAEGDPDVAVYLVSSSTG
jgi:hypothetical protein